MIRRLSVTLAVVALTSTIASGCSTFSKNGEAAKVDGTALSIDDFEALNNGLAKAGVIEPATDGEYSSNAVRSTLTRWVLATSLRLDLAKQGVTIDDAAKASATSVLQANTQVPFDTLDSTTQDFLIDELAGQSTLVSSSLITDAEAEAAYRAGLTESNTLCLRVIGFPDSDTANTAYQQLLDGADFAGLADANNTDGSLGKGGVFTDATTKSECVSAASLNAQVGQALAKTDLGVPAAPQAFTGADGATQQFFIFMQRPWDEVADAATPLVRQALGPAARKKLLADAKATVDSRYGMWDAATLTVLPTR